jgi:uncharacterized SAM-binding protein YcdF (DUF218 family)
MQVIVDIFKQSLRPAETLTILAVFAIGALLLYYRDGRLGRRWITTLALVYWVLATPACASWLEWPLVRPYTPIRTADEAAGAHVIVVLPAGTFTYTNGGQASVTTLSPQSAHRAIEAARLYVLTGRPQIIASGGTPLPELQRRTEGAALADALVELGVPREDIVQESDSKTTYEQAVLIRPILDTLHADRFLLVTSANHMRRSMAIFEAQGLRPIPAVVLSEDNATPRWLYEIAKYLPSKGALTSSDATLYEYAALVYYWSSGRLRAPAR